MTRRRIVLQLDFDGTLTDGDVNEGIFLRFLGPEWSSRIEDASRTLRRNPSSPALIETLQEASARLDTPVEDCLAYARSRNRLRPGLRELIETATRLGMETHVISYGFDFYVRDYLRSAGVDGHVAVHCGETSPAEGGLLLRYLGPDGEEVTYDWKLRWTRRFLEDGASVVYAGDGGSDVAPAQLCHAVFARDALLRHMPPSYTGTLRRFETLRDVARGLEEVY
jgi:HAD superfamily phosphoserine phosphatase-like hydrolase